MDPEAVLLARIRQGDEGALDELYHRLKGKVYTLAFKLLGNREEAEEVLQETFYKLYTMKDDVHIRERSPRPFIYTLARNEALSKLRRRRSRPVNAEEWDVYDPSAPFEASLGPEVTDKIWLERGLAHLTDEERQLIEHAYFGGYSYSELAEHTRKPLGTVRSKIRRAILKLRTVMKEGVEDVEGEEDADGSS